MWSAHLSLKITTSDTALVGNDLEMDSAVVAQSAYKSYLIDISEQLESLQITANDVTDEAEISARGGLVYLNNEMRKLIMTEPHMFSRILSETRLRSSQVAKLTLNP